MKRKHYYRLLTMVLCLSSSALHAQNRNVNAADSSVTKLITALSIKQDKAVKLHRLLSQPVDITAVMSDPTLTMPQKQNKIMVLTAKRHRRIDSLLTNTEKQKFMLMEQTAILQSRETLKEARQKHQALLDAVPHQQLSAQSVADTIRKRARQHQ